MTLPTDAVSYFVYDPATGEITSSCTTIRETFEHLRDVLQRPVIAGEADGATQYLDLATMTVEPKQPGTAVLDGLTLTGLPDPCVIVIEDELYPVSGGTETLSFSVPGPYPVTVLSVRHLPQTFTVIA